LELLNELLPSIRPSINLAFGYSINTWSTTPLVRENCIQASTQPTCIANQAMESFVPAVGVCQSMLRKLFLDFQDLRRIHD
jgi:hypothetical protein